MTQSKSVSSSRVVASRCPRLSEAGEEAQTIGHGVHPPAGDAIAARVPCAVMQPVGRGRQHQPTALQPGLTREDLPKALDGHVKGSTGIIATFSKP